MGPRSAIMERDAGCPVAIPEIGFCWEKHRLVRDFVEAVKEMGRLQKQQIRAVIGGDELDSFEGLLEMASREKDFAKYALLRHIESHHC
jgi:hypothetical protein